MTYTPNGGKPVSVSIPLRVFGPLYQSAVKRCDATGDCDDEQLLFWVAKVNGCAALPNGRGLPEMTVTKLIAAFALALPRRPPPPPPSLRPSPSAAPRPGGARLIRPGGPP
jgi:hypothetical protein